MKGPYWLKKLKTEVCRWGKTGTTTVHLLTTQSTLLRLSWPGADSRSRWILLLIVWPPSSSGGAMLSASMQPLRCTSSPLTPESQAACRRPLRAARKTNSACYSNSSLHRSTNGSSCASLLTIQPVDRFCCGAAVSDKYLPSSWH